MKVLCKGHDQDTEHNLLAGQMAGLIEKFQEGDVQIVTPKGIESRCLLMVLGPRVGA